MKRKMKWILIENIMGYKYIDGNRRKKIFKWKKNFKFLNNYNIFKWELKIFDIWYMYYGNYMYIWFWGY